MRFEKTIRNGPAVSINSLFTSISSLQPTHQKTALPFSKGQEGGEASLTLDMIIIIRERNNERLYISNPSATHTVTQGNIKILSLWQRMRENFPFETPSFIALCSELMYRLERFHLFMFYLDNFHYNFLTNNQRIRLEIPRTLHRRWTYGSSSHLTVSMTQPPASGEYLQLFFNGGGGGVSSTHKGRTSSKE